MTGQSTAPQYDGRGNMTRDHQGQTYEYDHYNRLSGVGTSIDLAYDPAGRLQETSGTGITFREMQYDGLDLIAEYDGSGTLTARVACPGPVPGCTAPARTSRWCNMPARRRRRGFWGGIPDDNLAVVTSSAYYGSEGGTFITQTGLSQATGAAAIYRATNGGRGVEILRRSGGSCRGE